MKTKKIPPLVGDKYGWMGSTCITGGRQNRDPRSLPLSREKRQLLAEVPLLSTHSLFLGDFLASPRSLSKWKGTTETTEVPLSQPCVDERHICRDTNLAKNMHKI